MDYVGEQPTVSDQIGSAFRLRAPALAEGDIDPAGEQVLGVPVTLTVT
jgi:hypothetical protein